MAWTHVKAVAILAAVNALFSSVRLFANPLPSNGGLGASLMASVGVAASSASSSGPNNGGTIITSSSTQYFTVTMEPSGSSQTGPIDGGSNPISIPNGSLSPSQAPPASASGTFPNGPAVPSPDVFVIRVEPASGPSESDAPGSKARRQSDGFVGNAGVNNPVECSEATQFTIIDGELTRGGRKVSTDPGVASAPLAVSPTVGLITRTWEFVDDELLWFNDSFVDGQATFCLDSATSKVFFNTRGVGNEPGGCTPVSLRLVSMADCDGLSPGNGLLPAEETLILPPGVYFPGEAPVGQACRVTNAYWNIGQFTLGPAPTGLSHRLWEEREMK